MFGWTGNILRINLTNGIISRDATDPRLAAEYIGARGLGAKILSDEVDPKADALGPANKLIFAPGPLSGTYAPSAGRYNAVAKSPLTGAIAASNSGGAFGPALKYAGYDAVIFEGKAKKPVYLWINDDQVEIRDASHLLCKTVPDTTDQLRDETSAEASVACIGPAGERLSIIAAIMNEMNRAAGRSGIGAVMGSKNLKAVVVRGTNGVKIADPQAFK